MKSTRQTCQKAIQSLCYKVESMLDLLLTGCRKATVSPRLVLLSSKQLLHRQ